MVPYRDGTQVGKNSHLEEEGGAAISMEVAMFSLGESESLSEAISVRKSQVRRAIQGQLGPARFPTHTI